MKVLIVGIYYLIFYNMIFHENEMHALWRIDCMREIGPKSDRSSNWLGKIVIPSGMGMGMYFFE